MIQELINTVRLGVEGRSRRRRMLLAPRDGISKLLVALFGSLGRSSS